VVNSGFSVSSLDFMLAFFQHGRLKWDRKYDVISKRLLTMKIFDFSQKNRDSVGVREI
jgi:hypothetical protein